MYQFMRDLIACRDWYGRDSGCILSRDEFFLCDTIIFWLLIDVCFLLLHVSFIFESHVFFINYSVLRVRFYNKIINKKHIRAKLHKRATYGHKVQCTYISQKQSFYKIELRCDFNYEMHRTHVRYRKTTVLQQKTVDF